VGNLEDYFVSLEDSLVFLEGYLVGSLEGYLVDSFVCLEG
jgi:hypothetical protein